MKIKTSLFVVAFLASLIFTGCSSIKVNYDYDKTIDFTQYKTFEYYGWAGESEKIINQLDRNRVEDAFGYEFARRGLTYVESGGDLVVTLFFVVQDKTSVTYDTDHYGGGYYGGYYGYGPGWGWGPSYSTTTAREYNYQVGTLVVDVYDRKSKQLVWESIGQGTIDDNPQSRDKSIPKAVAQIMEVYPVQPTE